MNQVLSNYISHYNKQSNPKGKLYLQNSAWNYVEIVNKGTSHNVVY